MRSRSDYDAFTAELTDSLAARAGVIGLVAVGSMASGPDEWSDHDFFVVTEPGRQEELRRDLSWLPRYAPVALSDRETEHGLQVVYDDGHLLEFAVFDLEELGLAGVNRHAVLLDRGGVRERMDEVASATGAREERSDAHHFAKLATLVLVGTGRARRGEVLSGLHFVNALALERLLVLLARVHPDERLDGLDPHRRFELVQPAVAGELAAAAREDPVTAGLRLLEIAERELRPLRPELAWNALDAVRRRLG